MSHRANFRILPEKNRFGVRVRSHARVLYTGPTFVREHDRRSRKGRYRTRRMEQLRVARGNRCEVCDFTNVEAAARGETLEFAHIAETDLSGAGRGREERIRDIRQHPDRYALMCHACHREFDRKLGPVSEPEPLGELE